MPIVRRLREFLDDRGVRYKVESHSRAYTAQEIAASMHVPGRMLAKTVVMRRPSGFEMAVLPAHHNIDVGALSAYLGSDVRLATEAEFRDLFPGCELGAMPPFGNLYGLKVHVARPLTEDEEIVFNCGTHTEVVRMRYVDFARLVTPDVGDWSSLAVHPPRTDPNLR